MAAVESDDKFATSRWNQIRVLAKRAFLRTSRDKRGLIANIFQVLSSSFSAHETHFCAITVVYAHGFRGGHYLLATQPITTWYIKSSGSAVLYDR